jgi:ATP-dependent Lon protease
VLFIGTANVKEQIPAPLLDRMEEIEFRGYTEREKLEIARRYLLPRQLENAGLAADELDLDEETIRKIVSEYTREAGVRNLERELGSLARKTARKIAAGEEETVRVGPDDLRDMLGQPKVHPEGKMGQDTVGVAAGVYYTPAGGDIMLVEASVMEGADDLVLTGQMGDVMKESARAALTYARTHSDALDIDEEDLDKREIHVHVPAGAVPKEGPSAGLAMTIALVSALSGHPVRHDVAMTGEITLTGRVLPIGGVKEKVLGAVRAGLREMILPADNEGDLEELPDQVREEVTFHLVESLDQVVALSFREAEMEGSRLRFADRDAVSDSERRAEDAGEVRAGV